MCVCVCVCMCVCVRVCVHHIARGKPASQDFNEKQIFI